MHGYKIMEIVYGEVDLQTIPLNVQFHYVLLHSYCLIAAHVS